MTLYMLRTRRGRVLVYNRPPHYDGTEKVWSEHGHIHAFSKRDSAPDWYDWVSALRPEVPRELHLLPGVWSPWTLIRAADGDIWIMQRNMPLEGFCGLFQKRIELPALRVGESLSIVFGNELQPPQGVDMADHSAAEQQMDAALKGLPTPAARQDAAENVILAGLQAMKGAPLSDWKAAVQHLHSKFESLEKKITHGV